MADADPHPALSLGESVGADGGWCWIVARTSAGGRPLRKPLRHSGGGRNPVRWNLDARRMEREGADCGERERSRGDGGPGPSPCPLPGGEGGSAGGWCWMLVLAAAGGRPLRKPLRHSGGGRNPVRWNPGRATDAWRGGGSESRPLRLRQGSPEREWAEHGELGPRTLTLPSPGGRGCRSGGGLVLDARVGRCRRETLA